MSASTIQQASVLNGRQLVMVVVVGLHALAIGGLMTMRIAVDPPQPPPAFKPLTSVEPPPPVDPPPPRPEAELKVVDRRLAIPMVLPPDIQVEDYKWVSPDVGPIIGPADVATTAGSDAGGIAQIPATEIQYRSTRSPDEYYPAISIQLQEQGTSVVRVCVGPAGRLESKPVIERSSGSRRLDAAAIQWAQEAASFTPATRNGEAVAACKGLRVNFKLR